MRRAVASVAAALAFGGVGAVPVGARPTQPQSGGTTLHITAIPAGLSFSTTQLRAPAGRVTIVMVNKSEVSHDVAIKGHGVYVKGKVVGKGGISTVTAVLKKGSYFFICAVDDHAKFGMGGTLTIT